MGKLTNNQSVIVYSLLLTSVLSRHLPGGIPTEIKSSPAVDARHLNAIVQCVLIPVSFCNKIQVAFCICVSAKLVRIILGSRVQYQTCGEAPGQCVLTCYVRYV